MFHSEAKSKNTVFRQDADGLTDGRQHPEHTGRVRASGARLRPTGQTTAQKANSSDRGDFTATYRVFQQSSSEREGSEQISSE